MSYFLLNYFSYNSIQNNTTFLKMIIYQLNKIIISFGCIRQNFTICASNWIYYNYYYFLIWKLLDARAGITNYLTKRNTKLAASGYNFPLDVRFFNYVVDTLWYKWYSMFYTYLPSHIIHTIIRPSLTLYLHTKVTKLDSHWKLETYIHSKD